jgi:hypothetical protein
LIVRTGGPTLISTGIRVLFSVGHAFTSIRDHPRLVHRLFEQQI